jgi:hypothetical protein
MHGYCFVYWTWLVWLPLRDLPVPFNVLPSSVRSNPPPSWFSMTNRLAVSVPLTASLAILSPITGCQPVRLQMEVPRTIPVGSTAVTITVLSSQKLDGAFHVPLSWSAGVCASVALVAIASSVRQRRN